MPAPLPKRRKNTLSRITRFPVDASAEAPKKTVWGVIGLIALLPVIFLVMYTLWNNRASSTPSRKIVPKIIVTQTPAELAAELTEALQKNDTQAFIDMLNTKTPDVNIVNSKGDPLIVAAATLGNYAAVEELILLGADVNAPNAFTKDTALIRSLYNGHTDIAQRLVYSGANINAVNNYKHSPLYIALEKNNVPMIELFLLNGVKEGLTKDYLFRSVSLKNETGALTMLKGGIDPNISNDKGNTPLIISASLGDVVILQHLLAYRADVNAANNEGNTALIYAARYNHPEVIKMLLQPQTMQTPLDVNAQNKKGETALYWGASKGYVEVVKRLLAAGADPTIAAKDGLVPYAIAKRNGRTPVLEWFNKDVREVENAVIEQDNKQILAKRKEQQQAQKADDIFAAAASGNQSRAEELVLSNRSLLTEKNKEGKTALLVAVENNQPDMVDYLVNEGARLFEPSTSGNALHMAVSGKNILMLKHLVQLARQKGQLALMLEYKTVPAKNVPALTPLGWAARACEHEMYNYLVSVGAREGDANQSFSPSALLTQCSQ
mgnify:CR=1 FL=1